MDADTLTRAVSAKVEALQAQLLAKVEANLSGDVLQECSGALKASIVGTIETEGDVVTAKLASIGVPYAAIQEEGGQTAPHEIIPVKAQALAFAGAAGTVFARRVQHPGSRLPARRYMAGGLEALAPDITGGLKEAVRASLGAA